MKLTLPSLTIRNILVLAFIFSLLNTYSYIDFQLNMSLGVGYVYVAKSLALARDFNVNEYWQNAGVDVVKGNLGYYIAYAPMASILMAIPYFVLQIFYFLYTNTVGAIDGNLSVTIESLFFSSANTLAYVGVGWLIAKILLKQKIQKHVVKWVLISYLFGSIALNYSVSYLNHNFAAFFILAAFYSAIYLKHKWKYFITGAFVGLAFLSEYPTILFSIAFFVYQLGILKSKQNWKIFIQNNIQFAIPVATSLFLLGIFNYVAFGNPFLTSERALYLQHIQNDIPTVGFEQNIFYGVWGYYLSPFKGLFLISPVLALFFFGIKKFYKKNSDGAVLALAYVVIMSLTYATWSDCFGATPFGPRYMTSWIPFLFIFVGMMLKHGRILNLFKILTVYGILICVLNMMDGLPSGKWFGDCRVHEYASYYKARDYALKQSRSKPGMSSVIYKYFKGQSMY